jgi:ribosomal protein S18 acetylase RimI-like enzyme
VDGGDGTTFRIRRAGMGDYDGIVAVWKCCGSRASLQGRESRDSLARQMASFPDSFLVAESDGGVVGAVLGSHDLRKGWINRLAVLPDFQRRGIGRKLVEACEAGLRNQGLGIFAAHVEPGNAASAALFESMGYRDDVPVRYFRKLIDPRA